VVQVAAIWLKQVAPWRHCNTFGKLVVQCWLPRKTLGFASAAKKTMVSAAHTKEIVGTFFFSYKK
jgi:hypothetical protein